MKACESIYVELWLVEETAARHVENICPTTVPIVKSTRADPMRWWPRRQAKKVVAADAAPADGAEEPPDDID